MHMIAGTLSWQYSRRAVRISVSTIRLLRCPIISRQTRRLRSEREKALSNRAQSRVPQKKATSKKPPKEVLPSRQAGESSDNAELAAGETPFTISTKKTAINPKMTVQVPDAVRDLAAKTIDQAEKAFGMFFDAAKKSLASIPSPGAEISKQALSFTEQNIKAALDHARKLTQATDLQQAMQIQSEPPTATFDVGPSASCDSNYAQSYRSRLAHHRHDI